MTVANFEIHGLAELEYDLRFATNEFPDEMRKGMRKLGNDFKKSCKSRTPDGKDPNKDASKKLIKKFGVKTKIEGDHTIALVYNSGRHFHLVENGHNLVRGKKVVGFVPGKHMMEQTRIEYADIVPERLQAIRDDILGRRGL